MVSSSWPKAPQKLDFEKRRKIVYFLAIYFSLSGLVEYLVLGRRDLGAHEVILLVPAHSY